MTTRGRAVVAWLGLAAALVLGLRALAPAQVPGYGDWLPADAGGAPVEDEAPGFGLGEPGLPDAAAEPAVDESPAVEPGAPDAAAGDLDAGAAGLAAGTGRAADGGVAEVIGAAAADGGAAPGDGGAAVPDAGVAPGDAGRAGQDAGAALTQEQLLARIEELQRRQTQSDAEQEELQAQIAELQAQLEAQQAAAARAEQSRAFRVTSLGEAVVDLQQADALLIEGTLDAAFALDRVEAGLAESLEEARTYGSGFEVTQTQRALTRVQAAQAALDNRDFYQAMRYTEAAMTDARIAQSTARSAR